MKKIGYCGLMFVGVSLLAGWGNLVGMEFLRGRRSAGEAYQVGEPPAYSASEGLPSYVESVAEQYWLKEVVSSDTIGAELDSTDSTEWFLKDCDEVNLSSGNLTIIQIEQEQQAMLRVQADQGRLSSIVPKVVGRCLTLESWCFADMFRCPTINYELYISSLNSIQLSGSGQIQFKTPFRQQTLKISTKGAGKLKAENLFLKDLNIVHSSKGLIWINNLICQKIYGELLGSGSLEVCSGSADHQTFFISKNSDIKIQKLSGRSGNFMVGGKRAVDVTIDSQLVVHAHAQSEGTILNHGRARVVSEVLS